MSESVESLSQRIGDLCLHWARLDQCVDRLFEPMLEIDSTQVACIIGSVDNFRQRCEILKRLLINEPPTEQWADLLITLLDFLGGKVAPLRNRFIHDSWVVAQDSTMRVDKRTVIRKYNAGDRDHVAFNLHYPTEITEIHTLTSTIWNYGNFFDHFNHNLRQWRQTGQIEEPDPQLIEQCNLYFGLLRHQWPKKFHYLLPEQRDPTPDDELRNSIANSYVMRKPE
ncbi:hypothetical protein [Altererythrobacter sp. ZODW24]|uniref:hypothetical protein n=1 Tax=Altererythrobacter sp. ZODW24 TaxID=2185142 RepID=UPI0013B41B1D|nr:hypothetical protein [Altererythrobacter sp. ZODW24]